MGTPYRGHASLGLLSDLLTGLLSDLSAGLLSDLLTAILSDLLTGILRNGILGDLCVCEEVWDPSASLPTHARVFEITFNMLSFALISQCFGLI